nr:hypothetical protein [Tanacetum cinerariifolium]
TLPSTNLKSNKPVLSSTGVNLVSSASGSLSQDNTKNNRIRQTQKKAKKNKVEDHLRTIKSSLNKASVVDSKATSFVLNSVSNMNSNLKCASCNGCLLFDNHDTCVVAYKNSVNASKKSKSVKTPVKRKVWKTTGKVFKSVGHIWKPTGRIFTLVGNVYPLTRIATPTIVTPRLSKSSSGQFCDSDLEVGFRQHTCFIHNLDGVDLLTSSQGNNLYTLSIQDMMASFPICLLSKASKTKSWLWHHTNQEKLYLLYMDLCGPMSVESVNEKKYILVIVDDYSRFTWVKFLRSKDETPDFIIKFLKMIQVRLKVPVRRDVVDEDCAKVTSGIGEAGVVDCSEVTSGIVELLVKGASCSTVVEEGEPVESALTGGITSTIGAIASGT